MRQDIPLRRLLCSRAAKSRTPITGAFELTARCNLSCKMCYIHTSACPSAQRERTAEEWLEMGRQAAESGAVFLLLTGGEPFLRPDLREIYLALTKMGLSVSLNSNGTLIDETAVQWLRQSPPSQINISLYGTSRETYARLCGVPEAYDRAVQGIDLLQRAGIQVGINATMSSLNDADMKGIADFGAERGLRVRPTYYLFPPVRRSHGEAPAFCRYAPQKAGQRTAEAQWLTESHETLRQHFRRTADGDYSVPTDDCTLAEGTPLGCLAGASQFWISWDGRMMPCGMMNEPCARPFDVGFAEAWRQIAEQTALLRMPPQCTECSMKRACPTCAAINLAENGSTAKRADYICYHTETYLKTLQALLQEEGLL